MNLTDLFSRELLSEMLADGYVRRFEHPNGDLVGYDYTSRAQWEREWNPVTRTCRGLIATTDGRIVARPFPKFFNYGEDPDEDARRIGKPFVLHEMLDGSLGISYEWNGRWAIATRDSFVSEQAQWATAEIERWDYPPAGPSWTTALFEIIYPGNRIVVDYGDRADLVYLTSVDWRTGTSVPLFWPLSQRARSYAVNPGATLADIRQAWAHLDDGNFEGFVATYADGHRVKIKFDEYVRLHRIMSSTSNRTIWEALRAGTDLGQLFEAVPDEFLTWAYQVAGDLNNAYEAMVAAAKAEYAVLLERFGPVITDRKPFALAAKDSPNATLLFAMLDGKNYAETIWKRLRPETLEYPPIGGAGEAAEA